jgi:hypothetical protein
MCCLCIQFTHENTSERTILHLVKKKILGLVACTAKKASYALVYHAMYSLYHAMYSLYHAMYSQYHAMYSLYHAMYSLYHAMYSLYHAMYSRYHAMYSRYHAMYSLYHAMYSRYMFMKCKWWMTYGQGRFISNIGPGQSSALRPLSIQTLTEIKL